MRRWLPFVLFCQWIVLEHAVRAQSLEWEPLDRGLVAIRTEEGVFLSWRLLATDREDISFNVVRVDSPGT